MSYPKSEMRCSNCQCWNKHSDVQEEKYGTCHRYPPASDKTVETHETWYCFEFFPNYESKDYKY